MNSLSTPRLSHSGILLAITFFASVGCDIRTALVHSEIEDVRAGGEWKPHLDAQRAKLKVALQPHEPGDQMPLENQPANDELANLMHADNQASEIAELHDPRRLINQLAEPISNPEYRAFVLRETELQEDEIPPNAFPIFRENIELPVIDNGEVMNLIDEQEDIEPPLQPDFFAPPQQEDPREAYIEHLIDDVRRQLAPVPGGIDIGALRPKLDSSTIEQMQEMFGDHPKFQELLDDIERFQTQKTTTRVIPSNIRQFIKEKRAFEKRSQP